MTNGQDLDTLIDLDGVIIEQAGGCWTKFEVRQVQATEFVDGHQLLKDFWFEVDKTLQALGLQEE